MQVHVLVILVVEVRDAVEELGVALSVVTEIGGALIVVNEFLGVHGLNYQGRMHLCGHVDS